MFFYCKYVKKLFLWMNIWCIYCLCLLVMKTLRLVLKKGEHILHCIDYTSTQFFMNTAYPGNVEFWSTQAENVSSLCLAVNILDVHTLKHNFDHFYCIYIYVCQLYIALCLVELHTRLFYFYWSTTLFCNVFISKAVINWITLDLQIYLKSYMYNLSGVLFFYH